MKNFYTNVQCVGNNIFFRGIVNGKRRKDKLEYYPTIFVPTNTESKYKTLDGTSVGSLKPGTVQDTRQFIRRYKDTNNFTIYGNNSLVLGSSMTSTPIHQYEGRGRWPLVSLEIRRFDKEGTG